MDIECVLRGVVADGDLEALLIRLDSFCDAATKATVSYHERVFRADGVTRTSDTARGSRGTVLLRVRQHEAHPTQPELLYLYPLQRRKTERTATRRRIAVPTVGNAADFVSGLGFALDHELHVRGTRYVFKDALVVTVTRLYKVTEGADPFATTNAVDPAHLVEIVGTTSAARSPPVVGSEMAEFAEQLHPLVLTNLFLEDGFKL
mmetsp:Transcript_18859/g.49107  ORF Transcript_18859/g.49107 Transcript_18859/m.49107 type:complete len:205 (+) Transcript_18859:421-1035(+)|eukprot:CAMPEP_0182938618 /NCGR_PEP_ID=MMETSP0105_2-20130417/44185_1 /TAXON_ID=81532 ORGANISM="Acanthoeca-like sp., Strain 10tr" /NCGR_SAMPLE_ID=MMETSP0105_2 /ASSEMBLY_ACC=CAM_ASM_000205 /LENGTH=204 /DNA_ID=CAMNT_0025077941 /DNA_START=403 /DNA_END=1017 /DNA_ORIENTATION=+